MQRAYVKFHDHISSKNIVLVFALAALLFLPWLEADATKKSPIVGATFSTSATTIQMGGQVDLILHVRASMQTNQVNVRFLIPPQVRVVVGGLPWAGSLGAGQTLDLPISIIVQQVGEFTLAATVEAIEFNQSATARMNMIASSQSVQISSDPFINMRMNRVAPSRQQQYLESIGRPAAVAVTPAHSRTAAEQRLDQYMQRQFQNNTQQQGGVAVPPSNFPRAATATTVSGTLNYQDDLAVQHPIRYAKVKILDGTTNAVLAQTLTRSDGTYSTQVTAASVKVQVWSEDFANIVVKVYPLGQPATRYLFTSAVTPVAGPATTVGFALPKPVRGPPNALANDSIGARAFIVLDALIQYQVQAFGMRGGFMPQVKAVFPNGAGSPCSTISCYSSSTQSMFILREDALDWDVIGHEFFHYVTDKGSNRTIDSSPGGSHDGTSQIGKNRCPTPPVPPSVVWTTHVCSRDEGMRLAWSEGLATFMSVRLQNEPASTAFGLTWPNFPNVGDASYQDTEDANATDNMEGPTIPAQQGYGSEESVLAMLWDLTDTPADAAPPGGAGQASDKLDLTTKNIWDWINSTLPCPTCDRVDRFWNAIFNSGFANIPALLDKAEAMALNKIAPELTQPAEAQVVPCLSPTFMWTANGDPSAAHNPNQFFLLISSDGFASDIQVFPRSGVPINTTQYKIPDTDWAGLKGGAGGNAIFTWVVLGWRAADADIAIPENAGVWASNRRTFDTATGSFNVIDFGITGGFGIGTAVTTQFQNMGMIFSGSTGGPAYIKSDSANPTSPVLSGSQAGFNGPVTIRFVDPVTGGACPVSAGGSLSAGFFDTVGGNKIQAFDIAGNLLTTILNQTTGVIPLFILRPQPDIARVVFSGEGAVVQGFAIDQVGFVR